MPKFPYRYINLIVNKHKRANFCIRQCNTKLELFMKLNYLISTEMGRSRLRKKHLSSGSESDDSLSAPKNKKRKQIVGDDGQEDMLVEASSSSAVSHKLSSRDANSSTSTSNRSSATENPSVFILNIFYCKNL